MIANVATVTREEAQDLLRASDRTLRRLVETGAIRAIEGPRGERLLDRDDVMRRARARDSAVTQDEAAALLGISVTSVGRMVRSGRLDSVATPGGKRRILRASVEAEIAARDGAAGTRQESDRTRHGDDESDRTRHDGFVTGQDTSPGADVPCADEPGDVTVPDALDPDAAYVPLDAGAPVAAPEMAHARRSPHRVRAIVGAVAAVAAIAGAVFALTLEQKPAPGQAATPSLPVASTPAAASPAGPVSAGTTPVEPQAVQPVGILQPAPTRQPAKTRHTPAKPKKKRPAAKPKPKPAAVAPAASPTELPSADSGSDGGSSGASDGGSDAGASGSSGGSDEGSACNDLYGSVGIC